MLHYFVRYKETIKMGLWASVPKILAPVIGFEHFVALEADRAFEARMGARRGNR